MDDFKKEMQKKCSVGGLKCNCCNPYKGKYKKRLNKLARSAMKQNDTKANKNAEEQ